MAKPEKNPQRFRIVEKDAPQPKNIQRRLNLRGPVGERKKVSVVVEHNNDPKQVIWDALGPVPEGVVQFSRILVAIYCPPLVEKTMGNIYLPDSVSKDELEEYFWQGKVGMIVAKGPQAYVDDDSVKFHGTANEIGDWVWFRPSDGVACEVNGVFCRILSERDIVGRLPHPDMVW